MSAEDSFSLDSILKQISLGSITIIVGQIAGMGIKFASEIVIGRLGGVNTYGAIGVGFSVLTILTMVSTSGIDTGIARMLPRVASDSKSDLIVSAFLYVLILSAALASLGYATAPAIIEWFELSIDFDRLLPFLLVLPFYALLQVFVGTSRGLSNPKWKVYTMNLIIPTGRLLFVLVVSSLTLSAIWYPIAYVFPFCVAAVVGVILLATTTQTRLSKPTIRTDLYQFSLPLAVLGLSTTLMSTVDNLFLAYYVDTTTVGLYNAAFVLSGLTMILMNSVGFLFMPLISGMSEEQGAEGVEYVYQMTAKNITYLSIPAIVIVFLLPDAILTVFYGSDFSSGATPLRILVVGYTINIILGRNGDVLLAMGENQLTAVNAVTGLAANIVLNILLIPVLGASGAAIATAAALVFVSILSVSEAYHLYEVHPISEDLWHLPTHVGILIILVLLYERLFGVSLIHLGVLGLLSMCVVIMLIYVLQSYDNVERKLARELVKHTMSILNDVLQ